MDAVWDLDEASVRDGHGRPQPRRAQAARVHDVHDDPRPPARQGPARRAGARARPTSTARSTRATEYADLRAQAEVAALVDAFGDVALGHFARQVADLDPERREALERLARER